MTDNNNNGEDAFDMAPAAAPTMHHDGSIRAEWTAKEEIQPFCEILDDCPEFEWVPSDVCLDPHDKANNSLYSDFRTKSGGRLTREVVDKETILVGFDKCGLSAVLNVPVPPGATLSVQLSTWCNPCHSGYGVENSKCFGVGMVPYGTGTEQQWSRGRLTTSIENGIQYYAYMDMDKLRYGGMLGSSFDLVERSFDVMQEGESIRSSKKTELSLDVIHVRIRRDDAGTTEFSFAHDGDVIKVNRRPADDGESVDMQLYLNCLGWADCKTYVQIHKVVYEPPSNDTKKAPQERAPDVDEKLGKKLRIK